MVKVSSPKEVSHETRTGTKLESKRAQPYNVKQESKKSSNANAPAQSILSKEELRKLAADQRKLSAPIRREIENTEKALVEIDEKLVSLESKLAYTNLYEENRKSDLMKLLDEQASLQQQHSDHEEGLLLAMTTLEEMEAEFE